MASSSSSWQQLKPRAYDVLRTVFGFESFRGVQEDAIRAVLEGRDTFVLMPTGGGKSLSYALPAVVQGGLVVVVSPLIALMQDQVAALQALGVAADYLSSTRTAAERAAVLRRMSAGDAGDQPKLALLYATPELLATDSFRQQLQSLHRANSLQMLAIDEAHCISAWGHDFRPQYRKLSGLRGLLPGLPCMALTATATHQVQQDILSSLRMQQPKVLITSFNRPNIHYTVVLLDVQQPPSMQASSADAGQSQTGGHNKHTPDNTAAAAAAVAGDGAAGIAARLGDEWDDSEVDDVDFAGYAHLLQLLKTPASRQPAQQQQGQQQGQQQQGQQQGKPQGRTWHGPVSIVYALKRTTVDVLVRRLSSAGLTVSGYHAALPDAVRSGVLERWRAGQLQVVVATVAFGMGVDKGDIELVVHFNLPRSVESFYQESGRAGRNGQPASSVLFYSTRDRRRMDWILQKDADSKAARKRKKAAKTAAAAAVAVAAAAGGGVAAAGAAADGAVDPVAAAAALRAFGAVVDLCMQPGCRRTRLLQHFGEQLTPQQQQRQQQQLNAGASADTANGTSSSSSTQAPAVPRCCDYCDNPGGVSAAVQQLKEKEVELLQRWHGAGRGGKRQRRGHDDDGGGTMFGCDGGGGSDDEDGSRSGHDSDDDIELDGDSAAAAAAVAKAAAAAKGPGKTAGPSTDAFLSAMLKAEQQHAKQQQAAAPAAGGGGDDPLRRLLAARKAASNKQASGAAAGVPDSVRASRRAKLAEVISSNTHLLGCTPDTAAELAAALEATVYVPVMSTAQHRVVISKLMAGVNAAHSWLELPELQQLSCKALGAVLRLGVEAVVRGAAQLQQSAGAGGDGSDGSDGAAAAAAVEQVLLKLAKVPVTVAVLEETGVARHIKALRKHPCQQVAAAAAAVIADWRKTVT